MKYIRFFNQLTINDIPLVGGKNASLGEMYQQLTPKGILIPNGFAVTADAYRDMLTEAGIWDELKKTINELNPDDVDDLARRGAHARELIYGAGIPPSMQDEILAAYRQLKQEYGDDVSLAVRSSACLYTHLTLPTNREV